MTPPPFPMMTMKAFIQRLGDLGDIIDMSIKADQGKSTYSVGELTNQNSTGSITNITASSTKDLYLAGAQISLGTIRSALSSTFSGHKFQVHLMRDTATLEIWKWSSLQLSGAAHITATHKFKTVGVKMATNEVVSLNLAEVGASCDVYGSIYGWTEDEGVSPQI